MAGDAIEVAHLTFGELRQRVLLERPEVGGEEGQERLALGGGETEVGRLRAAGAVGGEAALRAGGQDLSEGRLRGRRHAGVAVEATGRDEQGGAAGRVALERLALDHPAVGQQVVRELAGLLLAQAEVRHAGRRVVLGRFAQVGGERLRAQLVFVGQVRERDAAEGLGLAVDFRVGPLVATDAAEVGEERASRGDLRGVELAGGRRRALRQHRGDVGRLLRGVGPGHRLGHQRARADGLRVVDPVGEEVLVVPVAQFRQHRRVLAQLRHARALGRNLRGVGMAGRAIQLGEEQATLAHAGRGEFGLRGRVREDRRRDRLGQEVLRRPGEPDERVALRGARQFGDEGVLALVERDRAGGGAVEQRLSVEAQLEAAGVLRREGEGAAHRREDAAFPLGDERTRREEGGGCLTRGHVEREETVGTDVGLASGGEGHGETGLRLGGLEAGEEEQGEE